MIAPPVSRQVVFVQRRFDDDDAERLVVHMSEPIGVAVVGLGWWGRVLADAIGRCDSTELVACFARTDEARDEFAADYGCASPPSLEALLADDAVDGVLYATPHSLHREHIEQAAAAGVHVFVEKPFALTAADGRAAIEAADAAGITLMVGHQRRRQAANRRLRAMVDDGTIGTPLHGESTFFVPKGYPASWRATREETPLGGMTGLGVHSIDTFRYLLGDVGRVSAFSNPVLDGQPLDHATGLLLEMTSGAVASLLTTHYSPASNRVAIFGDQGAGMNEQDGTRLFVQSRTDPTPVEVEFEANDPLVEQMSEFAGAIRGTAEVETGGEEGLAVVSVLQAAIASVARGTAVDVAEFSA